MVLMTMIARVADGLPLAASMQEDEQVPGAFHTFCYIDPQIICHFTNLEILLFVKGQIDVFTFLSFTKLSC